MTDQALADRVAATTEALLTTARDAGMVVTHMLRDLKKRPE